MKTDFEKKYHSVEEKHWWFVGRREIIVKLIKKIFTQSKNIKILEIGCSGGPLLKLLLSQGYSQAIGIDNSKRAIQLCKERGLKNVHVMDGVKPNFDREEFDIIIASDVLEHIQNDKKAIKAWKGILKKGGVIICFVPALRILWSKHDEDNKHYRRYTKNDLKTLFLQNNYWIVRSSYWNFFLFFPALIYRLLLGFILRKFPSSQLQQSNSLLNFVLSQILKIENVILNMGFNFPIGISSFVIARKI